jgi:hypothetical protein
MSARFGPSVLITSLLLLSAWACSSPTQEVDSVLGAIKVTVMLEGDAALPDSLVVLFNGDVSGTVGDNGIYNIPYLPPGEYLISLRDEWENCWLRNNHRPVTVERRETSETTFIVQCQPGQS